MKEALIGNIVLTILSQFDGAKLVHNCIASDIQVPFHIFFPAHFKNQAIFRLHSKDVNILCKHVNIRGNRCFSMFSYMFQNLNPRSIK